MSNAQTQLPKWLESLIESWDGCMYDAPGETIDVGQSIRSAAEKAVKEQAMVVPEGYALVPLRPSLAMCDVMDSEGWSWPDLLAAACAVTEDQHAALEAQLAQEPINGYKQAIEEITGGGVGSSMKALLLERGAALDAEHGMKAAGVHTQILEAIAGQLATYVGPYQEQLIERCGDEPLQALLRERAAAVAVTMFHAVLEQRRFKESRVVVDFRMATELLDLFGGKPGELELLPLNGHTGEGLYAYWAADREGSVFLGQPDAEATPSAANVATDRSDASKVSK